MEQLLVPSATADKNHMTSLEIAEVTGKQHAHVMRDIRSLLEQGLQQSNFGLMQKEVVVICSKFITFVVEMTTYVKNLVSHR